MHGKNYPESKKFDYGNADKLVLFAGTHPKVMKERIEKTNWKFTFDPTASKIEQSFRRKMLARIE